MGLNKDNGSKTDKQYVNLKLVAVAGPTDEKPKFEQLEDFLPTGTSFSSIENVIVGNIKQSFTAKKGRMGDIYGFKAMLNDVEDENVTYVLEATVTNASKDLLNSLLGAGKEVVTIGCYLNKKGYPTTSVKTKDGKFVEGVMKFNEIDKIKLWEEIENKFPSKKEESGISLEEIPF